MIDDCIVGSEVILSLREDSAHGMYARPEGLIGHRRPILSDTAEVFDFDIDSHGARVVVRLHPLCSGCLTDAEVDASIELLKENLDAVSQAHEDGDSDESQ
jgi:hypothetical protein